MTALRKENNQPRVTLQNRGRDEHLRARPCYGDHKTLVDSATHESIEKHMETLQELAKV